MARPNILHRLVATGQHDALFHDALAAFGVRADDTLGAFVPGESMDTLADRIAEGVTREIAAFRPDLLIVQGDTTTAWAAALAAHAAGVPVAHVEAGLRSGDPNLPWPEERNRIGIDRIATLLFAPTAIAAANLAAEPDVAGEVIITGNTGIDALLLMRARLPRPPGGDGRRLILATSHRRENIGEGIAGICAALVALAGRGDVAIVVPVHPNPAVQAQVVAALGAVDHVTLLPALDYPDMVGLMLRATLILSDSGGLQEEAPALGIPLLVLRPNSERPEAVAAGNARIVGTDPARIVAQATRLLDDPAAHARMARPAFPFGRGDAAATILDAIERWAADRRSPAICLPTPPPSRMGARRKEDRDGKQVEARKLEGP